MANPQSQRQDSGGEPSSAVSKEKVAQEFISSYYKVLNDHPSYLHQFYGDESSVVVSETQDEGLPYTVVGDNMDTIKVLLQMFSSIHVALTNCTPQYSMDGSLMLLVTGKMTRKLGDAAEETGNTDDDVEERIFTQAFLLARQEKGFYVRTDTLQVHSKGRTFKVLDSMKVKRQSAPAPATPPAAANGEQSSPNFTPGSAQNSTPHIQPANPPAADYSPASTQGQSSTSPLKDPPAEAPPPSTASPVRVVENAVSKQESKAPAVGSQAQAQLAGNDKEASRRPMLSQDEAVEPPTNAVAPIAKPTQPAPVSPARPPPMVASQQATSPASNNPPVKMSYAAAAAKAAQKRAMMAAQQGSTASAAIVQPAVAPKSASGWSQPSSHPASQGWVQQRTRRDRSDERQPAPRWGSRQALSRHPN